MVIYTCEVCKKIFNKKFDYDIHMNKISKCYPNKNSKTEENELLL
jgi:uncharacterized C2H2 Zn-finger protein